MKTTFDKATRAEMICRISAITEDSKAQWGKMTVYQMLKHCTIWEEMALGKKLYKQALMGRLFGKMALKSILQDAPMKKNMPTMPGFKITGTGDVQEEKTRWITLLQEYGHFAGQDLLHPFFGKMTAEQWGYLAYKHADHHLKQFNV